MIRLLATAAVTGFLLNAAVAPSGAAAQSTALASDSNFIATAGSLGLLQAKLGKMAQEKGTSAAVRDFGKKMVDEYAQANEKLADGAKQAAYPSPILLRQHKQVVDRFSKMGKGSFDKNYMAEALSDHDEAVRLYQQESESGKITSLKQLAITLLPAVQQHQALARETAGTVGADVTATAKAERQGT
jgi:putative membrane protein